MIKVKLPTLHTGQVGIWQNKTRRNGVRCGRRWGKTKLLTTIAGDRAIKGRGVGIFTPERKQWTEVFDELKESIRPIIDRSSKTDGLMRLKTGGKIDFWAINDNDLAGRGREYHVTLIDEAAFAKKGSIKTWSQAIEPTLLTTQGEAWAFSTPFGIDPDNMFHTMLTDQKYGFTEFHAPTSTNPYVPADELERLRRDNHPDVFRQEYLAEFVDWSGTAFFSLDSMRPLVAYPTRCDGVYAVIDSAVKTGKEHDGTAVIYVAINKYTEPKLTVLDWDIVQIEGGFLELWLPTVFQRCEELARQCNARNGSLGVWIEDKASGTILLQQAARRGWTNCYAIDGDLTAAGKDERALSVSGYVYRGEVKLSEYAHDKTVVYKEQSRNHFISQVCGYRLGVKDQQDDLTDAFCYSISIGLGDSEGH